MEQIKKLIVGDIYEVTESCGMLMYQGKFLGVAKRDYEEILVFENVRPMSGVSAKFFSAVWNTRKDGDLTNPPSVYLRSAYSGESIEELGNNKKFALIK